MTIGNNPSFGQVLYLARDRLQLNPQDVDLGLPGAQHLREILQASAKIPEAVNGLCALQGVGQGRILPTGVTPELARLVIRESCSQAELLLNGLDRQQGRA